MRRSVPLVLVLLVGALAIAFWPSGVGDGLVDEAGAASHGDESERALAEGGDGAAAAKLDGVAPELARDTQRVEEQLQPAASAATTDPYAEDLGRVLIYVRDGEGNPVQNAVAGALVIPELDSEDLTNLQGLFFAAQGVPTQGFPVRESRSNEEGVAEIRVPVSQELAIYARAQQHRIALDMVEVQASLAEESQPTEIELVVLPGGFLQVSVVDELGTPVEDAAVVLMVSNEQSSGEIPIQFLLSDEAGKATFAHLSFATYHLEVVKDGHQYHRQEDVAVTTRGEAYLDVTISRGSPVTGTVVDSTGVAQGGVRINLRAKDRKHRPEQLPALLLGTQLLHTVTDELGRFEVSGLVDETSYSLAADPERGLPAHATGVNAGDDVYIELPATAFVQGRVLRPDGNPDDDVRMQFISNELNGRGDPRTVEYVNTVADGRFMIMLPPGEYSWYAVSQHGEACSGSAVSCFGEVELGDILLKPGGEWQIKILQPDGSAVRRADFESFLRVDAAFPQDAQRLSALRSRLDRTRFRNGETLRKGLSPGRYIAEVDIRGYLDARFEGTIQRGQRTQTVITATQAGTVNFVIRDAQGQPVKGKYVFEHVGPLPAEWEHLRRRFNVQTNSKGGERTSDILPGTWRLRASAGGGLSYGEFQVVSGSQTLEISLPAE